MNRLNRALHAALIVAMLMTGLMAAFVASAQDQRHQAIVSIYRIAPGKHLDFLKWMAAREAIDREVGIGPTQWYAHLDGDSWDYVGIAPVLDDATSDKVDAATRKHGLKSGMAGGLELRTMMASHTDTISAGPYSAADLIGRLTQP